MSSHTSIIYANTNGTQAQHNKEMPYVVVCQWVYNGRMLVSVLW